MKSLIIAIILLCSLSINAQQMYSARGAATGTIGGKITNSETKKAIEYASIAIYKLPDSSLAGGTVSDHSGQFKLEKLAYGEYYLAIDFIGFEKKRTPKVQISQKRPEVFLKDIALKPAALNIKEVEIEAEKSQIEYKLDKKIINVSQDLTSAAATAVEVLENTPSIQTDIDGNISLRGSSDYQVLVDGKPSVIDGNELLQQIPAATIDHIEIITNPSAKYDPDGIGGIINVILKKNRTAGMSGLINASYGSFNNYSFNSLFNYRTRKFNFFIGAELSNRGNPGSSSITRRTFSGDTTSILTAEGDRSRGRSGYEIKGGFDYDINILNSLSFSTAYGNRGHIHGSSSNYHQYTDPFTTELYYLNESYNTVNDDYLQSNLFYLRKFERKGQELTANATYTYSFGHDKETVEQFFTDASGALLNINGINQQSFENELSNELRLKVDYTHPFDNGSKLETGYQSKLRLKGANYSLENFNPDNETWVEDPLLHNDIDFKRNIHSAYATFSSKLKTLEYMIGLRGEYTDRLISSNVLNEEYPVQRFDFFPTLHISKQIGKTQQLMASYGRRIHRPREWSLDPFPSYVDQYNIRIGNPSLDPEYINSYELSYQLRIKQKSFISIESYLRQTKNVMQRVSYLGDNDIMYHSTANLTSDQATGIEFMFNSYLTKWWTLNLTFNIFNYSIEGELLDETVNQVTNTWSSRFNSSFNLPKDIKLQINGFYNAPTVTAQGDRNAFVMFNAGLRKDFLDKKLSATLQVRDIFKTMQFEFNSYGPGFETEFAFYRNSPTFMINLSYRINNYKQKRQGNMEMEMEDGGSEGI